MVVGVRSLDGLRDVRRPGEARLQSRRDTCGLFAVASILGEIVPARNPFDLSGVRGRIRANRVNGRGIGLTSYELMKLLDDSVPETAAVLIEREVTSDRLVGCLGRGHVISHVDGNHWVRVLGAIDDAGSIWVRLYDPARGTYEQLLSSFMIRAGNDNQMIWVRE
jgi:hypothetical protein